MMFEPPPSVPAAAYGSSHMASISLTDDIKIAFQNGPSSNSECDPRIDESKHSPRHRLLDLESDLKPALVPYLEPDIGRLGCQDKREYCAVDLSSSLGGRCRKIDSRNGKTSATFQDEIPRQLQAQNDPDKGSNCLPTCYEPLCQCNDAGGDVFDCFRPLSAVCANGTIADCAPPRFVYRFEVVFCPLAACLAAGGSYQACNCKAYGKFCELYEDYYCEVWQCCQTVEADKKSLCFLGSQSEMPTEVPSEVPTVVPTESLSEVPTAVPTEKPTFVPSEVPSSVPTEFLSEVSTISPSEVTSAMPSEVPPVSSGPASAETEEAVPINPPTHQPEPTTAKMTDDPVASLPTSIPTPMPTTTPKSTPPSSSPNITSLPMKIVSTASPTMNEMAIGTTTSVPTEISTAITEVPTMEEPSGGESIANYSLLMITAWLLVFAMGRA